MNKTSLLAAIVFVFFVNAAASAQDPPKFEIAGEFTTMERVAFDKRQTEPGLGGRFTYNLNRVFSFEAAGHFFPRECFCEDPGRATQVVGGVKVGKRFDNWGVFAKARPGVFHHTAHFGGIITCLNQLCPFPIEPFTPSRNHFAMDIGGVVEFYPSRRIVTRFDAGDTIIHAKRQTVDGQARNPVTRQFDPFLFVIPGRTSHNFQFIASVGVRF